MLDMQSKRLAPDNSRSGAAADPESLHRLGVNCRLQGRLTEAEELLRAAITLAPQNLRYHQDLGKVYRDIGLGEKALACFYKAASIDPACASVHVDLGCQLFMCGRTAQAGEAFRRSISLKPDEAPAYNNLGLVLESSGLTAQAAACFQKALQLKPAFAQAWNNLGNIHQQQRNIPAAQSDYRRALSIDPDFPEALNNLGRLYRQSGNFDEALTCFEKACKASARLIDSFINLGNTYQAMGRLRKARTSYLHSLKIDQRQPVTWFNLGVVAQMMGEAKKSAAFFKKALRLKPGYDRACASLVSLLVQHCAWDEAACFNHRLDRLTSECLRQHKKPAETPFLSIIRHADPELNLTVARAWSIDIGTCTETRFQHGSPVPHAGGRLRVGYLSNNFRNHPGADLVSGILARHDRRKIEIVCYSYGINDGSRQRKRIEQASDRFVDIASLDDQAAARKIYEDRPNILVDLVGHTRGSRLALCAMRPAPLQVRYLGFAGSSGADFFDYLIGDPIATPPDQAVHYSEKLVLMPHSYHVNNYAVDFAEPLPPTACDTRGKDSFLFGCFNASYKIDQRTFACWTEILKRVPNASLWLMVENGLTSANLKRRAQEAGICPERIHVLAKIEKPGHMKRIQQVDLVLDTLPVSGAASIADALWAGVPVLTVKGAHFASRMSDSILEAAGIGQLVVESDADYVRRAVELSSDRRCLQQLREKVRQARSTSPIFNPELFAKHLETAYARIWERYRKALAPETIRIGAAEIPA